LNPYRSSQATGVYILDTVAIHRKVRRIPKAKRRDVTRAEYNILVDLLNERGQILAKMREDLETQFKRIAQMQVQLDEVRTAWTTGRRTAN
jgi:hypothetical protein